MFISEIFFKSLSELNENKQSQAHEYNLDAAQREMDRRDAEGEDMTGARIDPETYEIIKPTKEGLADEFMAMAKAKGMNPRLRGTPDEERARTDAMLKQRAVDRANAPAPAGPTPDQRDKLEAKLKELEAKFDPDFEYSDDYSFWSRQNEIKKHINSIKKQLAQGVAEGGFKNKTAVFSGYGTYMKSRAPNVFKHYGIKVLSKEYSEDEDIIEYTVISDVDSLAKARAHLERSDQFGGMILKQGVAEGIRDLGYDAQSLIFKLRRDVEEKRLRPTREAVLAAARELAGDMDFAPELLVRQVLGKNVAEMFADQGSGSTRLSSRGEKRIANTVRKALAKNAETPDQIAARKDFEAQTDARMRQKKKEQGVTESYPKHQDLSGISTDKLKAYLAKQGQQQNPGEGNQVKRVRAELQRRQQGVAEGYDEPSSRDAVMSSIIRRITMQHLDALGKYGPQAIMDAAEETADWVGDVDEIGSSDVSIWTRQTLERLGHK